MQLVDLKFKPGVDKQDSAYSAGDQRKYIDSDFVRFHYGKPERWGGWAFLPNPNKTVVGVVRDTHSWIGLDGTRYLALGTDRKLYIYSEGKLYDITPLRQTESLSNPFTTNGTTTVSVADAAHGASVGDFVTFDSFSTIDGLDMNKEFEVTSVTSASAYTVTHTSTASGSTSGGGGSGNAKYQISVGPATSTYGYGWGTETWGASTWDTARSSSNVVVAGRNWSLDNFGEDLIATVLDGGTFIWDTSGGLSARATALSNAPTASRFSIVSTDTRHLMIFGTETTIGDTATQDDLLFRFSDREDATDYTPVATNEAGSLRITDGSRIIGAVKSTGQILVWTDTSLHGIQFVGTPFTFGLRQLGANAGLIAQHAAIEVNGVAYWMSDNAFYLFDGVVKKMPCSVQDFVFDDLSYTNKNDIAVGLNTAYNEIIWYYPSADASQIDRSVAYNYLEGTWYTNSLGRTTWLGAYVYEKPIATEFSSSTTANVSTILGLTAGASFVYEHETGNNQADGTAISAFLETGSVEIADGDSLMSVSKLVPDFDNLTNTMTATLTLEQYPQSSSNVTTTGSITSTTEKINVRGRGRAVKIKYQTSTVNDTPWRLGSQKIQIRPDGRR
jgi:hypothetical protein|tara:strand:- start:2047 stop:3891 length:1845 start_codon:yes stop_codon:yes gene_type:complete